MDTLLHLLPHCSLMLNATVVGFFKGKKGLRQGDRISPYIFVLVMEAINFITITKLDFKRIKPHPKCKKNLISCLCFAGDVLLFCHGDLLLFTQLRRLYSCSPGLRVCISISKNLVLLREVCQGAL